MYKRIVLKLSGETLAPLPGSGEAGVYSVQAGAVKAAGLGAEDVVFELLVAGRGVDAVGIETLVQHQPLENAFAVDQAPAPLKVTTLTPT